MAFSTALREAFSHPAPPTPETIELTAKVKALEEKIAQDQAWIDKMKAPAAPSVAASGTAKQSRPAKQRTGEHAEPLSEDERKQREEFAQARLTLDQDELADAQQDLMRAGGDRHGTLQRMLAEQVATHQSLSAAESS